MSEEKFNRADMYRYKGLFRTGGLRFKGFLQLQIVRLWILSFQNLAFLEIQNLKVVDFGVPKFCN